MVVSVIGGELVGRDNSVGEGVRGAFTELLSCFFFGFGTMSTLEGMQKRFHLSYDFSHALAREALVRWYT